MMKNKSLCSKLVNIGKTSENINKDQFYKLIFLRKRY